MSVRKGSTLHKMSRLDMETRRQVVVLKYHGCSISAIKRHLLEKHVSVSTAAIYCLLRRNKLHNSIVDCSRKCIVKKLDKEKLCFIDEAMAATDELTARRLRMMLQEKWPDLRVALPAIKWAHKDDLGWVRLKPKYC